MRDRELHINGGSSSSNVVVNGGGAGGSPPVSPPLPPRHHPPPPSALGAAAAASGVGGGGNNNTIDSSWSEVHIGTSNPSSTTISPRNGVSSSSSSSSSVAAAAEPSSSTAASVPAPTPTPAPAAAAASAPPPHSSTSPITPTLLLRRLQTVFGRFGPGGGSGSGSENFSLVPAAGSLSLSGLRAWALDTLQAGYSGGVLALGLYFLFYWPTRRASPSIVFLEQQLRPVSSTPRPY